MMESQAVKCENNNIEHPFYVTPYRRTILQLPANRKKCKPPTLLVLYTEFAESGNGIVPD